MNTKEDVLKNCTVEGLVVKLPSVQLERKLYQEVAKSLELIGGKWKGGKVFGFVFNEDPTDLLNEIATGEKRNLKKEFQFFATPNGLADYLVELANLGNKWTIPSFRILEPSAGQGAIIDALHRVNDRMNIYAIELMELNYNILKKKYSENKNVFIKQGDFLEETGKYNCIIANPPFHKNSDISHIRHMYEVLEEGGRLVSVASKHWQISTNKKETEFRNWLDEVNAEIIEVEKGTFKESGTEISTVIIIIDKK